MRIVTDENGHRIVVIPDIIFKSKRNIRWSEVEKYLQKNVGQIITIAETNDIVYIGKNFPDEFKGSNYTRSLKNAIAKVKANAAQGIPEMLAIATEKRFNPNKKDRHSSDAGKGWYYYTTRFALPIYDNEIKTDVYNIYSACLLVNCTAFGKFYLYDLVDIKREASTPLKNYIIAEW